MIPAAPSSRNTVVLSILRYHPYLPLLVSYTAAHMRRLWFKGYLHEPAPFFFPIGIVMWRDDRGGPLCLQRCGALPPLLWRCCMVFFVQAKCVLHVVSRHFIGLLLANGHDRELVVAVLNNLDFTSVVSSDHLLAVAVQAVQLLHRELFAVVDAGISASIHAAALAAAWLRQCVGFWVPRASKVVPGGGLDRPVGTLLVPSGGSRFWV